MAKMLKMLRIPEEGLRNHLLGLLSSRPREIGLAQVRMGSRIRSQGPRPHGWCTVGSFQDESQGFPGGLNQQDVVSTGPMAGSPHSPPSTAHSSTCSTDPPTTQPGGGVGRVAAAPTEESFPSRNFEANRINHKAPTFWSSPGSDLLCDFGQVPLPLRDPFSWSTQ